MDRSSLINLEFKTDLMRYLAQFPNAPVKSLPDILDRGDFHAALEATFKLRNAAVADPEEIRQVQARRRRWSPWSTPRSTSIGSRRSPIRRSGGARWWWRRPQRGTTCQLSASTGFPAMAMPAGFTTDGVPIGFEMLGPAWSDARLLSLAFAYEQAARPPAAAHHPAAGGGRPPAPIPFEVGGSGPAALRLSFRYDRVSGALAFGVLGLAAGESPLAAALHGGAPA